MGAFEKGARGRPGFRCDESGLKGARTSIRAFQVSIAPKTTSPSGAGVFNCGVTSTKMGVSGVVAGGVSTQRNVKSDHLNLGSDVRVPEGAGAVFPAAI